jgi:3-oxoacid CoA-transferase
MLAQTVNENRPFGEMANANPASICLTQHISVPQKKTERHNIQKHNITNHTNNKSTMMSLTTASLSRNSLVFRTMQRTAIRLLTSKVAASAAEALADLSLSGARIALGGFGTSGVPETLVNQLSRTKNAENLTLIALDSGPDGYGPSKIIETGKARKFVTSFIGESKFVRDNYFAGKMDLELVPLGTIAAQLRAAGSGIPAFYTHTGVGTMYANGGIPVRYSKDGSREVEITSPIRTIDSFGGKDYILETALQADVSLVKAWKADTLGNLVFHGTARNSNPDVAKAGKFCVAEAEEIVQAGDLDPNEIHLPGIFVHKVIHADINEKPIQKLRIQNSNSKDEAVKRGRKRIIKRLVKEFKDGMYVNLGIGIPVEASNYIDGIDIELHAENGLLGAGPYPKSVNEVDPDFINAGKGTYDIHFGTVSNVYSSTLIIFFFFSLVVRCRDYYGPQRSFSLFRFRKF